MSLPTTIPWTSGRSLPFRHCSTANGTRIGLGDFLPGRPACRAMLSIAYSAGLDVAERIVVSGVADHSDSNQHQKSRSNKRPYRFIQDASCFPHLPLTAQRSSFQSFPFGRSRSTSNPISVRVPSDCFTRCGNPAWLWGRTANFAAFGSWPGALTTNAESLRYSDAPMRVAVPRRRGPAGLRDLFAIW